VTGVDCAEKLEMLRTLGADRVIDYTRQDFTLGDERYDLIYDVASTLSLKSCKKVLHPKGLYVIIGHDHFGEAGGRIFGNLPHFFGLMARAPFNRHLPSSSFSSPEKKGVMAELGALLESGQLTPVIDRTFPLGEVPEAMRYMQEGGGVWRIIITP
jgi:NADPH:quinone reductase-like Zn-dependent oxidoreductase